MRIAISAARGLALVTAAKLFGSDSLTVMAREAHDLGVTAGAPFAVAVDARRGMLYLGLYDEAARRRDGPLLIAPDDAANLLPGGVADSRRQRGRPPRRSRERPRPPRRGAACRSRTERRRARRARRGERGDGALATAALLAAAGRKTTNAGSSEAMLMAFGAQRASRQDRSMHASSPLSTASAFSAPWDEAAMAQFTSAPGTLCLIGSVGDGASSVVGGLLIARKADDEAEILTFGVAPPCRNQGLGRALLQTAVERLRASGAKRLFLEVGGRQRSGAPTLSLLRRSARRPPARLLRSRRRCRDLQSCPLTVPCR